jgi:ATP-dependent RNA helicase RhlE
MEGDAVSLVCIDELDLLHEVEAVLRQAIPREFIPGFEPDRGIRAEPIREVRGGNRAMAGRGAPRGGAPARGGAGRGAPARQGAGRSGPARRPEGRPTGNRYPDARPAARPAPGYAPSRPSGPRNGSPRPAGPAPHRDSGSYRESGRSGGPGGFVQMPGERFAKGSATS